MNIVDLIEIVVGNMSRFSDTGEMARSGAEFFDTPTEMIAIYNTSRLPYIIYQEEGFTHYRSKEFINKNKGFISVKAEGQISRFIWSEKLGLPFDRQDNNESLLNNQSKMMVELGAEINV